MAERLGWSRWKIAKMENGQSKIDLAELPMIADALKITLDDLWRRVVQRAYFHDWRGCEEAPLMRGF